MMASVTRAETFGENLTRPRHNSPVNSVLNDNAGRESLKTLLTLYSLFSADFGLKQVFSYDRRDEVFDFVPTNRPR